MDFSLAALSPEERAAMQESIAQKQRVTDLLRNAGQRANRHNTLAAVAQMANNPGIAKAALMAQKAAQQEASPVQMGQQGFMLPEQGEFVESPMYVEEKQAGRQAKADALRQMLEARAEQARLLEQGRNERAGEGNELRRLLATQAEQGRQDRLSQTLALRELLAGKKADAAPDKPQGKVLSGSDVRKLTDKEGLAVGFAELTEAFKPEFAGTPGIAGAQNTLGKYQPLGIGKGYGEQSNWWQNYNDRKNVIRHELFGSALTAPEKAAFDAANVTEGMDPKQIATRLGQQRAAAARAYNKLKSNYGRAGYRVDQFEDISAPEAATPGGGLLAPSGLNLPPGFKVIGRAD